MHHWIIIKKLKFTQHKYLYTYLYIFTYSPHCLICFVSFCLFILALSGRMLFYVLLLLYFTKVENEIYGTVGAKICCAHINKKKRDVPLLAASNDDDDDIHLIPLPSLNLTRSLFVHIKPKTDSIRFVVPESSNIFTLPIHFAGAKEMNLFSCFSSCCRKKRVYDILL